LVISKIEEKKKYASDFLPHDINLEYKSTSFINWYINTGL